MDIFNGDLGGYHDKHRDILCGPENGRLAWIYLDLPKWIQMVSSTESSHKPSNLGWIPSSKSTNQKIRGQTLI